MGIEFWSRPGRNPIYRSFDYQGNHRAALQLETQAGDRSQVTGYSGLAAGFWPFGKSTTGADSGRLRLKPFPFREQKVCGNLYSKNGGDELYIASSSGSFQVRLEFAPSNELSLGT